MPAIAGTVRIAKAPEINEIARRRSLEYNIVGIPLTSVQQGAPNRYTRRNCERSCLHAIRGRQGPEKFHLATGNLELNLRLDLNALRDSAQDIAMKRAILISERLPCRLGELCEHWGVMIGPSRSMARSASAVAVSRMPASTADSFRGIARKGKRQPEGWRDRRYGTGKRTFGSGAPNVGVPRDEPGTGSSR